MQAIPRDEMQTVVLRKHPSCFWLLNMPCKGGLAVDLDPGNIATLRTTASMYNRFSQT